MELERIKEEILKPKNKATIDKAIVHQNRIKFHAQTDIERNISRPLTDFISWVGTLIPKDKLTIFKSLFRFPVKTNITTGICFDKLSRVFDGRNPAFNYQFMNSDQRDDWEWYRQDVLKEPSIWQTKGWEYFKTEINSVLVIDMPIEPDTTDKYPQPYFYWLTIDKVISYKADHDTGIMEYIIFYQGHDKIAVFDGSHFEVYRYDKDKKTVGEQLVSNEHGLGYCPARFFWNEPLKLSEPDIKNHPLSKNLESLDWYLFFFLSKRHLDLYAPYPIYSGYAKDCNYQHEIEIEGGNMIQACDGGGYLLTDGVYNLDSSGLMQPCPKCKDQRIAGVGSFIEVPVPKEGDPDLRNPVQILTVDSASLQYNVDEVERLKEDIITSTVGVDSEIIGSQALNEVQVSANFEDQSTVLNRIKKGFESAQQFVDETICKLRYGNSFVSAKINLGTEFYTENPVKLRERYKTAKESGASESELDALGMQIIETEYRHNPTQLQRMIILSDLEPYRHLTRQEILDLNAKGLISNEELQMKFNFINFVRRFERENTNILEFGTQIPYNKKIEIINNKFKDYVSENNRGNEGRKNPEA